MKDSFRVEKDSMGEVQVPATALYAAQTQRAVENFPISGITMPSLFIRTLALIKSCCAQANQELKLLDPKVAAAIIEATKDIEKGHYDEQFPIDIFQTGSGTSSNMNMNEVIANLASTQAHIEIHPNNDVNMSQSSNDVIPTAIHVSAMLALEENLKPALEHLSNTIKRRAKDLRSTVKSGRTHLMDAMPITLGQELGAWAVQIDKALIRCNDSARSLTELTQGGTAVGTGINCHPDFPARFCANISTATDIHFKTKPNKFEGQSSQDSAVEMSGQLRTLAVSLTKIANDLRWMNSGPLSGLGEISLPALQPGSSIMPGKVNPVIPEAVAMVCAQVIGNDTTITLAGQSGNFQLNVMLPVIAYNLLQSFQLLSNCAVLLADKAIADFTVNEDTIEKPLKLNPVLITALNRIIGYEKGAAIAKKAYAEKRPILEVAKEETDLSEAELHKLLDPAVLTRGGIT